MSKLHDLVIKNKRKEYSRDFPWTSSYEWQKIIEKLENLDFYYDLRDDTSAIVGLLDFDNNKNYLLFEVNLNVPQIVRPVSIIDGSFSVTYQNEYRCPEQYDNCLNDLAYAISQNILPDKNQCLSKVLLLQEVVS